MSVYDWVAGYKRWPAITISEVKFVNMFFMHLTYKKPCLWTIKREGGHNFSEHPLGRIAIFPYDALGGGVAIFLCASCREILASLSDNYWTHEDPLAISSDRTWWCLYSIVSYRMFMFLCISQRWDRHQHIIGTHCNLNTHIRFRYTKE